MAYLKDFKILLIIDNLETILDDRVRRFLSDLSGESKVLITSRIGVGAYECPVKMESFDETESLEYLLRIAHSRRISALTSSKKTDLLIYCRRMKNNPLFIKWFASLIQIGKRPNEVLANPEEFLDFAISNVYEYLDSPCRTILRSLMSCPEQRGYAELAYMTELDPSVMQQSLHTLLTTNMMNMSTRDGHGTSETVYELPSMARQFLERRQPVTVEQHEHFMTKRRQLTAQRESAHRENMWDKYSFKAFTMRSLDDGVVVKYLRDAYNYAKQGNCESARTEIARAKSLSPGFFEVFRVEAYVAVQERNYPAARSAYEMALEIEPSSSPLLFWYAGFALRYLDDPTLALNLLERALILDPSSTTILREIARAKMYIGLYEESFLCAQNVFESGQLEDWESRKIRGLQLECLRRLAEEKNEHRQYSEVASVLERIRMFWQSLQREHRDDRTLRTLSESLNEASRCEQCANDMITRESARKFAEWASAETGERGSRSRRHGVVERVIPADRPTFAFVNGGNGSEIYLNARGMRRFSEWNDIAVGVNVSFSIGHNREGDCAVDVSISR